MPYPVGNTVGSMLGKMPMPGQSPLAPSGPLAPQQANSMAPQGSALSMPGTPQLAALAQPQPSSSASLPQESAAGPLEEAPRATGMNFAQRAAQGGGHGWREGMGQRAWEKAHPQTATPGPGMQGDNLSMAAKRAGLRQLGNAGSVQGGA